METTAIPVEEGESSVCSPRTSIHTTAEERLRSSGYLALRGIACIARDDVIYPDGCLPSYFLKQLAQGIVAGVVGVRRVINRIDVLRPVVPAPGQSG